MRKIILLFGLATLLMAVDCDHDYHDHDYYACTQEARAGLNVTVTLNGNVPLATDVILVTARDGNYIEDLYSFNPDESIFSGVYERPGSYIVTVRSQGYVDFVSQVIVVNSDRCHVIPVSLQVDLIPE